MGFRIIASKRVKKTKSPNSKEVLERLQRYLEENREEPIEILCGFWKDQQHAITYQEIRQAVLDGYIDQNTIDLWMFDYSLLIANQLRSMWEGAISAGPAGQPILDNLDFEFNIHTPRVMNWINERGADFVTACTMEQKKAIKALLVKQVAQRHSIDELSKIIRPCIGLTEGQTKASLRFYDNIVSTLKKEHPRMNAGRIKARALDRTIKYAERQHRQRALNIAQTEMAFAYNKGADEGIRQAQSQNLLGNMKKRWSTSGDANVCDICRGLEGTELEMDEEFDFKGRVLFAGQKKTPPAHPRCACAIEYIETEPPVFPEIPAMNVSITESNSYRNYSDEEINSMAEQTEKVISKHVNVPSKWSGKMVITDNGIDTAGHSIYYGKLWDCDILTKHETAPAIILHEQLHARSASYYPQKIYSRFQYIEESAVQFLAEEICITEGIEIIASGYDKKVEALKKIGRCIDGYNNDFDFAKELFAVHLPERLNWLSERLYDTMRKNPETTVADYKELSKLLDVLY